MIPGRLVLMTSGDQDAKTSIRTDFLASHHYFMMDRVQDLFISFQGNFVPDVDFVNGRFASSDWPANKRERGVIFDPFWGAETLYVLPPASCVFSYAK